MQVYLLRLSLLVITSVLFAGCGSGKFVPVSGTVTMDGNPVVGADIVFAPKETEGNPNPGSVSIGKTDSAGKFTLATPQGKPGAAVATHRVGISLGGIDEAAIQAKVDEAYAKNNGIPETQIKLIEQRARAEISKGPRIPTKYNDNSTLEFEVPAGGTEAANFDLTSE